jgi:methyl-accepting chemotaxis protein PixJ
MKKPANSIPTYTVDPATQPKISTPESLQVNDGAKLWMKLLPFLAVPIVFGGLLWGGVKSTDSTGSNSNPAMVAEANSSRDNWIWLTFLALASANAGLAVFYFRQQSEKLAAANQKIVSLASGESPIVKEAQSVLVLRQEEAQRTKLVSEISVLLRQSLKRHDILNTALEQVRVAFDLDRAIVFQIDDGFEGKVIAESLSPGAPSIFNYTIVDSMLKETRGAGYDGGRVHAMGDSETAKLTSCHKELLDRLKIRANIVAPLIINGHFFGLFVGHKCEKPRNWSVTEIELFSQVANQVCLALNQAESLEQRELEAQCTKMLAQVGDRLRGEIDKADIFNFVLQQIRKGFDLDRAIVYEFLPDYSGTVVAEALRDGAPSLLGQVLKDSFLQENARSIYGNGKVTNIASVRLGNLTPCHEEFLDSVQVRANIIAPIIINNRLYGLLMGHHCYGPRNWKQMDVDLFSQVATQIALALSQVESQQVAKNNLQQIKQISEMVVKLRKSLKREDIYQTALEELRSIFKLDRAIIYQLNQEFEGTIVAESLAPGRKSLLGVKIVDSCIQNTRGGGYETGRVTAIPDIRSAKLTECHKQLMEELEIRANLVAPIIVNNKLFGLAIGHQCHEPRHWEETEIEFFVQMATQLGLALNQIESIQQLAEADRETAATRAERAAKERLQQRALELLMQVEPIGRGNLTIRADVTEDEIGTIADSYNAMVENLQHLVKQMKMVSEQVASNTHNSGTAMTELSTSALEQAQAIQGALDRVQDITKAIEAVSGSATTAAVAANTAIGIVRAGDTAMNHTVEEILTLRETIATTAKKVKRLGESSQQITKVVNLIGSFAAQTNLLALNANIEAARAGEEGRGFAVVAEEVRSLARQSAAATSEIEKIAIGIQAETNEVVAAMEAGTEQVLKGTHWVEEARSNLTQIYASSQEINNLVESIAQAVSIQSEASTEVTANIGAVAEIANATATRVDTVRDSVEHLNNLAAELRTSVGQFMI